MARQYRTKENEGSRTPPMYSLPCVVHRLSVSWHPSCVAIDGVVLEEGDGGFYSRKSRGSAEQVWHSELAER